MKRIPSPMTSGAVLSVNQPTLSGADIGIALMSVQNAFYEYYFCDFVHSQPHFLVVLASRLVTPAGIAHLHILEGLVVYAACKFNVNDQAITTHPLLHTHM